MAKAHRLILAMGLRTLLLAAGHATTEPSEKLLEDLKNRLDEQEKRLQKLESARHGNLTAACNGSSPWYPICGLATTLDRSEEPLRTIFLNCFMLGVGVLMVLQFHMMKFVQIAVPGVISRHRFKIDAARLVGKNTVILNLYYTELWWIGRVLENPFYFSLAFIFFDAVVLWFGSECVAKLVGIDAPEPPKKEDEKCIRTRYTDYSHPTGHVTAVFFSQMCLFIFFVLHLNEDPKTHDGDKVVLVQWLVGIAVTSIAGNEETGAGFHKDVWDQLQNNWPLQRAAPVPWKLQLRMAYDMIVNAFCREVLLGLAPVVLATVDRWDFIKDCLAIFFISRLDDLDDHKSLKDSAQAYRDRIVADGDRIPADDNLEEKTSHQQDDQEASAPLRERSQISTGSR